MGFEFFDPFEDFGDGFGELDGDEVVDATVGPEGACEGDVLHDGDAFALGGFADEFCEAVGACDDDAGDGGFFDVVSDADGEVGGVGHDDVGIFGGFDGVGSVEEFVTEVALGLFDFGGAFHFFVFAFDFVFGHHHFLGEVFLLEDEVDEGDEEVAEGGVDGELFKEAEEAGGAFVEGAVAEGEEFGDGFVDEFPDEVAQEGDFCDVFEEFEEVFLAEDFFEAFGGVEFA